MFEKGYDANKILPAKYAFKFENNSGSKHNYWTPLFVSGDGLPRDCHRIGWLHWVMEGTIYRDWETQGVAAPRGKP
jgi:hypothetical protein